jgi:hypothetical protein
MPGFLGQDAAVKQEMMAKLDTVSHHCQFLPFIQLNITAVLINTGMDTDTSLSNTHHSMFAGTAIYAHYLHSGNP